MQDSTRIQRTSDVTQQCEKPGCVNLKEVGSNFCLVHGGNMGAVNICNQSLRNYRLTQYGVRCGELRGSSGLKDLRDEVAILRMVLEQKLNMFDNPNEMILQSGAISDLILKIEKVVTSCNKLEKDMSVTLERSVVLNLADSIVAIIGRNIEDKVVIETIVREMGELFTREMKNTDNKN